MPFHVTVKSARDGMTMESEFTCRNHDLLIHLTEEVERAAANGDQVVSIEATYEAGF